MADPFDIETPTQRRIILAALVVYLALFLIQYVTGSVLATAAADLLLAALVIPASVYVIQRARDRRETNILAVVTGVAFLVAGVTIGYEGLATLEIVPVNGAISLLGTVALLAAFVLYLYQRSQSRPR
ncbi:hypothetical protein SAMN05216559_2601 [Halomicrobium zhouii]|uniref:Uncharacterized protein n=1 Tax=Halomicrobium zhouii TaxID=767519 RepID=A0A1I6LF73_9EURY|nr:hypothetical protein [Halomicrobium zhouii]SFS02121.1 hypothetical protein SAMN05216559_2601 [Halomicrobium zhouii]